MTVELTLDELAVLSRGVGNRPRRPPRRDLSSTIEDHYEIIDHGDFVTVDTPYGRFKVAHREGRDPPWIVTDHDAGHSWAIGKGLARNVALAELLERLGLLWGIDDE